MKFQVGDFMYYKYLNHEQKEYGIIIEADNETVVVHWLKDGTEHGYLQDTNGFFKVE